MDKTIAIDRADILNNCKTILKRLSEKHIKPFAGDDRPVLMISDTYSGVWLEHFYDAVVYAGLTGDTSPAVNEFAVFLDNLSPDGRLPCYVADKRGESAAQLKNVCYTQIQECVSVGSLALMIYEMTRDLAFLKRCYDGIASHVEWQKKYRRTLGTKLIEQFCEYDTGHDNSFRMDGTRPRQWFEKCCPDEFGRSCYDEDFFPLIAPDMNAVFYGDMTALDKMGEILGIENSYKREAEEVKEEMARLLYDRDDCFFYDVDRRFKKRRFKTCAITSLYAEKLLDKPLADEIYFKHLRNPLEFWTPYPFPSAARNERLAVKKLKGNCWGYYSEGLTALRTMLWMDFYDKSEDKKHIMNRWLSALTVSTLRFGQELDPISGKPSECSEWYSSTMLYYLCAAEQCCGIDIKELYNEIRR